jgi:Uma2 family endonuclease
MMTVEEYLHTSFEPDCEYLDGEIVERNTGEIPHSDLQANLCRLLWRYRATLGLRVLTEIRVQIHPQCFRVPDIAAWRNDDSGTGLPTEQPDIQIALEAAFDLNS